MVTSRRLKTPGRIVGPALALVLTTTLAGCQRSGGDAKATAKPTPPAKVEGAPKEADLATVTLTPEAETHLGIETAEAVRKRVPRTTTYAGEVTIPPGGLTAVTSPFVGLIKAPGGAPVPTPGMVVKAGQPVFLLIPILTPEARATLVPQLNAAEGQVKQAKDQLAIAKVNLDRTEKLVRGKLASSAALVDATAQYDLAQTNLKNAEDQSSTLSKVAADAESGSVGVQTIESPATGILQNVHVQIGQKVPTNAPLFEVAAHDPVWVKVPVYVGDASKLAIDRPSTISGLADAPGSPSERPGKPVAAPPSGDPLAATVNVFYEVSNRDARLRPGERIGVSLPLLGNDENLTVPRSSLVRDIHGGAWVYERLKPHVYSRRRVSVDRVVGDLAVVTSGSLKPGASVVSVGAAELYGTEFGGSK